ncbi:MAG: GNAT family N-acetyltransferase [Mycobacterium sp.]|uniref:GNAT family N-acetyltransferase n=1 Tax=Mycobacterium sp. TaxID=1785 RepID=UPI001ED285C9|nr:GNAT family N-acetyltransferase [Mycobacterium sp.]MBW0016995.1 GNAT family N-acetyltransferase [Mycobacterium sp.]
MTEVRPAVPNDAYAVARVHVQSWQTAYRGLIAQDYLDALAPDDFARRYTFGRVGLWPSTLVAVDDPEICGFATIGLCRDIELPNFGELMALYVAPAHVGTGIGRRLISAARERLRGRGVAVAVLWVLDGNVRARRFYERDGWSFDGTRKTAVFGNVPAEEVRYRRSMGVSAG